MTYQPHPLRIQRRRIKGFRLPPGSCSVTRPGKWGNPFDSADKFERVLFAVCAGIPQGRIPNISQEQYDRMLIIARDIGQLRGFKLACWCDLDCPCHGDSLAREANQ